MPNQVQTRTIKTKALYRSAAVSRELIDQQKRTVEVIFSTESPVQHWFGQEILDHAKSERFIWHIFDERILIAADAMRRRYGKMVANT